MPSTRAHYFSPFVQFLGLEPFIQSNGYILTVFKTRVLTISLKSKAEIYQNNFTRLCRKCYSTVVERMFHAQEIGCSIPWVVGFFLLFQPLASEKSTHTRCRKSECLAAQLEEKPAVNPKSAEWVLKYLCDSIQYKTNLCFTS